MRASSFSQRWVRRLLVAFACTAVGGAVLAQGRGGGQPQGPPPNVSTDTLLRGFSFRSIGPSTMMGRLDDIEGAEKDPMIMYIGFATGGLWKSVDGGAHWRPLFDNMPLTSIGDIAIAPSDPNVVYVGMGEPNNRQSSSIGDGVYGTRDGGVTWTHLGLEETQSIARIRVDPTNPNIVYVAALGHLFGPNEDRGLYKSIDGGKTWTKSKYIDADTGFTDLAIDPVNPKILYAASYSRRRTFWGLNGGGPNSGLWKTTDSGATWTRVQGNGWPVAKDGIYGRIAIDIYRAKPTTMYAQIEVGASGGTGAGTAADGGPARGGGGGGGGAGGGRGGGGGAPGPIDPNVSGVYRSDDAGKTWRFVSAQNDRPMYFSQIRVDPMNDQKITVGGNPGRMSLDGGKTWQNMTGSHTDYHAMWFNPKDSRIMAIGHDGGLDMSNDGGVTWTYHNDIAVGQFYQVSADMRHPYFVCGGLQDNNAWCGPSALRTTTGPLKDDWFTVAGGDGFYTRQDPTDWAIVYAESQDGNMSRHDLRNGTSKSIRPNAGGGRGGAPTAAETPTAETPAAQAAGGAGAGGRGGNVLNAPPNAGPFRFYWNAPIEISPHNPAVVYMAAQYLFKSTNRGDSWWMNPTDLTKNINRWAPEMAIMGVPGDKPMASKHDGYATSSTATQVRESPSRPGVIWVGTEDGNLQVSQDGGVTFANVIDNVVATGGAPKGWTHVSRIEPSHFDPGTAYVALDYHRTDDWRPYLYKTTDFGRTWRSVVGNLPPKGNIEALREDYDNPNLLFVGTEFGLYVTLDQGKEWKRFMTNLPTVRVDDILIHPRERDLILATHGRSIWIADDIAPLEQLGLAKNANASVVLFDPRPAVQWKSDPQQQRHPTNTDFRGQNPQGGTTISVWARDAGGAGRIEFLQGSQVVSAMDVQVQAGMNRYQWGMQQNAATGPAPAAGQGGGGGRGGGAGRGGGRGGGAGAAAAGGGGGGGAGAAGAAGAAVAGGAPPAQAAGGGGGGGGRGGGGGGVPFTTGGGGRGGGGGGDVVEPGSYTVRLTLGGQTYQTSVVVLEDIWAHAGER